VDTFIRFCPRCGQKRFIPYDQPDPEEQGGKNRLCKRCRDGRRKGIPKKEGPLQVRAYKDAYVIRILQSTKVRCKASGLKHTITAVDIPTPAHCIYLGVLLDYRRASERGTLRAWNAASLDRINNKRGYVPDNIQTISDLANRMKQNATIPQLIAFARGVLRAHDTSNS
jgi:hypothetical protein